MVPWANASARLARAYYMSPMRPYPLVDARTSRVHVTGPMSDALVSYLTNIYRLDTGYLASVHGEILPWNV